MIGGATILGGRDSVGVLGRFWVASVATRGKAAGVIVPGCGLGTAFAACGLVGDLGLGRVGDRI
jgi:hypothetical protein